MINFLRRLKWLFFGSSLKPQSGGSVEGESLEFSDAANDYISDNNESEGTFNRTAAAGVSNLVARADHKHPYVNIPNPGVPVLSLVGDATLGATLTLDTILTTNSVSFKIRVQVSNIGVGNSWIYISVPSIAGFRPPEIIPVNSYFSGSNQVQPDDGLLGASPRGPLMGVDWTEWSSTQRLYYKYFRRSVSHTNWCTFIARYTKI